MKYENTLKRISGGELTRGELRVVRENALTKKNEGDSDAQAVLQAVDSAVAKDASMVFMGFCPNADIDNRLDTEWKAQHICTFDYDESVVQMDTFRNICAGDLIVLKKVEQFGKTMRLYGHGRVTGTTEGPDGRRMLEMNWSAQDQVIEVPLIGCQSTVNLRSMESVEAAMPEEFFDWLYQTGKKPDAAHPRLSAIGAP
jgi:hypothetical protein